jgi:hypothetical protein
VVDARHDIAELRGGRGICGGQVCPCGGERPEQQRGIVVGEPNGQPRWCLSGTQAGPSAGATV